jgi:cell wall-associated NlpC family hydrolase
MSGKAAGGLAAAAGLGGVIIITALSAVVGVSKDAFAGGVDGSLKPGTVPAEYSAMVSAAGSQCPAAPPAIIAAQLHAESNFNPTAVSPVGAQGISQFMPGTWAAYGRDENADGTADPFDPVDAIAAQGRYDCQLAADLGPALTAGKVSGDLTQLMLAAYNAGPGAVLAAGGIPQNGETEVYVAKIMADAGTYTLNTGGQGTPFGAAVVAAARQYLGTPYVWGGGGPTGPTGGGFDCSGLTQYAIYQASGGRISLLHFTDFQLTDPRATEVAVSPGAFESQLAPGDLVFFDNGDHSAGVYHHVGLFIGGGQMIHAPQTGDVVKIADLRGSYWQSQSWKAVRFG